MLLWDQNPREANPMNNSKNPCFFECFNFLHCYLWFAHLSKFHSNILRELFKFLWIIPIDCESFQYHRTSKRSFLFQRNIIANNHATFALDLSRFHLYVYSHFKPAWDISLKLRQIYLPTYSANKSRWASSILNELNKAFANTWAYQKLDKTCVIC